MGQPNIRLSKAMIEKYVGILSDDAFEKWFEVNATTLGSMSLQEALLVCWQEVVKRGDYADYLNESVRYVSIASASRIAEIIDAEALE